MFSTALFKQGIHRGAAADESNTHLLYLRLPTSRTHTPHHEDTLEICQHLGQRAC